ncbi:ATP-binding cassette sub-family C member 4-like [Zophobas morio]|uniref:ATP-binding cassette sub-family C member 4-like n=1 Tax=Zophobas morio TaxID=2755281 RepID=UPI00308364C5
MDIGGKKGRRRSNPKKDASIFSKITFWYTVDLFRKGFKRELEEDDLYEVLPEFESCSLGDRIEHEWNQQKHRSNAMFVVLLKMFGPYYCILSLNMFFHIIFHVVQPMIVSKLVFLYAPSRKEVNKTNIYLYSALLILLLVTDVVCRENFFFLTENLIIKIRTAFCTLVYRKLLKLPGSRLRHVFFGNITNLITRDINAFDQFFINFSYGWSGFVIIIITCCNMYQNIGFPTIIVMSVAGLLISAQVLAGVWIVSLKQASCKKTDKRIAILQEVLSNMRSTKFYVWEKYVDDKLTTLRKKETNLYLKVVIVLFSSVVSGIAASNITFCLVLMMYNWFAQQLSAETIYFITGAFINLCFSFSVAAPYSMFNGAQVIAAVKRMQTLVQQLETHNESPKIFETLNPKIELKNVTVAVENRVIFDDISFDTDKGLTLVTGAATSGKSVLLMTLLKEFEISKGDLVVEGRMSYAPQEPWLFPSTIKQNIIFGSTYNHERYQDVIKACDLQYDFDLLEDGDSTVVADRGINLSKGQQSRINLARAIYKNSDIYLLDDCLSSLDPLVARFIFSTCILKFLRNKIVFLVSHNTNFMPYATKVLKLSNGCVDSYENTCIQKADGLEQISISKGKICNNNNESGTEDYGISDEKTLLAAETAKRVYGENKNTGSVSFEIYKQFINLGGGRFFLIIIGFFLLTQLSLSAKDSLVRDWANLEDEILETNNSIANNSHYVTLLQERNVLKLKFVLTVTVLCATTLIRAIALFVFCRSISIKLHNKMLKNILNASLRFFDTTFIGNMVNRFSKDLANIDENIPFPLHHLAAIIFESAGNLVIIASTNVRLLIPIFLLFISFALLRYIYLKTGRPLKRLDASTKSPLVGYVNATLDGLVSIKVFQAEQILKEEFEKYHNVYNSASFLYAACLKAFVFASDLCVSIFVTIVVFQFAIFNEGVLPADFGLAVSQAFIMGTTLYFGLYKGVEVETQMTSMERAIEYTTVKNETKTGLEIKDWPKRGDIEYENVSLSVDNSKTCVLKNINFFIKSPGKIGIVGRTGAGKSSIISALFRLYEFDGKIVIDGIDIKTLSLSFLRTRISVIPQDPILFDSSLRDNIDPGQKHTDEVIWNVLETVKLKESLETLNVNIKEMNLTCGQKQLICLARVLVSNNKILVLDEMIENVDFETENLISNVINKHFSSCTVIKIAHKLKFVMDCDKVLVLDKGEIVEYDSPKSLLQDKTGLFYKMVHSTNLP